MRCLRQRADKLLAYIGTQLWAIWPHVHLTDSVKSLWSWNKQITSLRQHKSFNEFCSHTFCDQASNVVHWEGICLPVQKAWDTCLISGVGWSPAVWNGNPIQVFLPGDFHRQRGLAGYNLWGHKESNTAEHRHTHTHFCDETSHLYFIWFINAGILITLVTNVNRTRGEGEEIG